MAQRREGSGRKMKKLTPYNPDEFEHIATLGQPVTVAAGKTGRWHVFTHNTDEYYGLEEEAEALRLFDQWAEEYGSARLYLEVEDDATQELELEDCYKSVGEFPY